MSVARQMAGSDAVSALGRLAGVTVDRVKSCSNLGTLLEATVCSQEVDSMVIEVISTMSSYTFEK